MLTTYQNVADVIAILMVCVTLLTVIAGKIEERRQTDNISIPWLINEVGSSLIAGYIAWEIYPHIPTPTLLTQSVFVVLAVHGGIKFITLIRNVILKANKTD